MRFLLRRLSVSILMICCITLLNFTLFYLNPGDPTNAYFGPKVSRTAVETLKQKMGYDAPWTTQWNQWCRHMLKGDWGYSWSKHRPVSEIIRETCPATLQLTLSVLILNLIIGSILGIFLGGWPHSRWGRFFDQLALVGYAVPTFLLAILFINVFSLKLGWLPPSGMQSMFSESQGFWSAWADRLHHSILPVTVLSLSGAMATARYVKEHMHAMNQRPFLLMARAKGLSTSRIMWHHAFRNALIPLITLLGLYFPFLLGSTFIIEIIFAWPGLGRVAYEAIFAKDYPVIMAVNLLTAVLVVIGNFIADMLYRLADPRMKLS